MVGVTLQLPIIFGLLVQGAFSWSLPHFPKVTTDNPCNGHQNGELVENLLDCHYYWKCGADGSASLQKCATGFAFVDGVCSRTTSPCSINPQACQGLDIDTYLPNLSDCSKLFICTEEGPLAASCPTNTTFDPNYNMCLQTSACSTDACTGLDMNAQSAIEGECGSYWQCSLNGPVEKTCSTGYSFNPVALQCQPSEIANCPPYVPFKPNCTDALPGVITAGEYCNQFYICRGDDAPLLNLCQGDLVFDEEKGYCVASTSYTCEAPVDPCLNVDYGTRFAVEGSCTAYLLCIPTGPVRLDCPVGYEFSKSELECVVTSEAGCSVTLGTTPTIGNGSTVTGTGSTVTGTESTVTGTGPTASEEPITPETGSTVSQESTPTEEPSTVTVEVTTLSPAQMEQLCNEHVPKTSFIPYPGNCADFIVCIPNGYNVIQCAEGLHFNGKDQCVIPEQAGCDPNATPGTADTTDTTETTETTETTDTTETTETTTTTEEIPTPEPVTIADPTLEYLTEQCKGQDVGAIIDYPGTCQRYIECSDPPTSTDCENDYFNSKDKNCGSFANSQCALDNIACANGVKVGKNPQTCQGYVICTANPPYFMDCNPGEGFDPIMGCVEDPTCKGPNASSKGWWGKIFGN